MTAAEIFGEKEREHLKQMVARAEKMTSGEIRLYIEDQCTVDVLDRAAFIFDELGMTKTALKNGVLIYVAVEHQKFAIIGDAGIHQKVGNDFWNAIKEKMAVAFKQSKFEEGLAAAILASGEALSTFFPCGDDDKNELGDDILVNGK